MGIVASMRKLSQTETSKTLEAEIARVRAEGLAATAEAERCQAESLTVDTIEAARELRDKAEEAQFRANRAAKRLPELEARRDAALARERAELEADYVGRNRRLYKQYREKLREFAKIQDEALAFYEEARATLGEGRAPVIVPCVRYDGIVRSDFVSLWIEHQDRAYDPKAPVPAPVAAAPRPRQRLPHEPLPHGDVNRRVSLADVQPPKTAKPRPPDDNRTLEPGEIRCVVLREGYEGPGGATVTGQRIVLPLAIATAAARNGAVEIVERRPTDVVGGAWETSATNRTISPTTGNVT